MSQLHYLIARNLSMFYKNKKNVLLCFFAIFIVFGLYGVFLRDFMIESVRTSGMESVEVKAFTDRLMLSGLLIVVNTTTCFGIIQLMIKDIEDGIKRDFLIAPITKAKLLLGYWASSIIISFSYTVFAFGAVLLFLYQQYKFILTLSTLLIIVLLIFISSILNSELLLCFVCFMKDTTTFSTFGNLYGMLSGFLAGTYLPYELYPDQLKQTLFFYVPTHLTSLIRSNMLSGFSNHFPELYREIIEEKLYRIYGVNIYYKEVQCSIKQQIIVMVMGFSIMLLFLGIIHKEPRQEHMF